MKRDAVTVTSDCNCDCVTVTATVNCNKETVVESKKEAPKGHALLNNSKLLIAQQQKAPSHAASLYTLRAISIFTKYNVIILRSLSRVYGEWQVQ